MNQFGESEEMWNSTTLQVCVLRSGRRWWAEPLPLGLGASEFHCIRWAPGCRVSSFISQPFNVHLTAGAWRWAFVSLCSLIKAFACVFFFFPSTIIFLIEAFKKIKLITLNLNKKGGQTPNTFWPNVLENFWNFIYFGGPKHNFWYL